MQRVFNKRTTAEEICQAFTTQIKSKCILVTGQVFGRVDQLVLTRDIRRVSPNSIGEALVTAIARQQPARLILAGRSPSKCVLLFRGSVLLCQIMQQITACSKSAAKGFECFPAVTRSRFSSLHSTGCQRARRDTRRLPHQQCWSLCFAEIRGLGWRPRHRNAAWRSEWRSDKP
jgi:hypothetical protein